MKSGFQGIGPRNGARGSNKKGYGSGKETLRFKANGNAAIEDEVISRGIQMQLRQILIASTLRKLQHDESTQVGIDSINVLLDSFMGINDSELAMQVIGPPAGRSSGCPLTDDWILSISAFQIWESAGNKTNSMDFAEAIDNSDLEAFGFTDDFIIELWGAITDARRHRRWNEETKTNTKCIYSKLFTNFQATATK